jgi:hypothetical protein
MRISLFGNGDRENEVMSKEDPSPWDEDAFWRKLVLPQEDRSTPWEGKGYRWFRSPNVIPIEQWRRHRQPSQERGGRDALIPK